ncbi:MAG: sigma-70 family RNA polymerase sigma factor [Fimbriimonadales bacterium]
MTDNNVSQLDPEILVQRYLDDPRPELRDSIMLEYTGTVERVARRYSGLEPFEDLVQVGFLGLLNALTKYDRNAGVKFGTYANYLIAGEIKHYLRDRGQTIRQPAWLQELRHRVNKVAAGLQQTLGRTPNYREIAEAAGVTESAVADVFSTQELSRVASLDATVQNDDEGDADVDKLDAAEFCPEQLSLEDRLLLESAMAQLRDLERQVLVHFHFDAMNQTEIAANLGISCNYVSHILRQSLAKLRKILSEEAEKDRVLKRQAEVIDYDVIDSSVGAYTEEYFHARFTEEMHRCSFDDSSVGLVRLEFTGLEVLERFYGSASVTDFLTDAADYLRENVRRLDMVCRIGASGFAIILPSSGQNVAVVRQRLVNRVADWMASRYAKNSPLAVKVGYANYPDSGKSAAAVFKAATPVPLTDMGKAA